MSNPQPLAENDSFRHLTAVNAISPPLPVVSTINSFVGRDKELGAVCSDIRKPDVRLLTLIGPGGVGKTRLAIQAAQKLEYDFADGVRFTQLAHTTDPTRVLGEIAATLGFSDTSDPEIGDRLCSWLRYREMLLMLDNLEQVIDCAADISLLLKTCPGVSILATSRVNLNVYGEHVFTLSPLSYPESVPEHAEIDSDLPHAIRLFVDRAKAVDSDFALTSDNLPGITRICSHLDGLPLAIELAAARIGALSVADLDERLAHGLTILSGTSPDVPHRLRTMYNAIAWSYELLDEGERLAFRRLAVFTNGFTLAAAAEVLNRDADDNETLALIESLVTHSLIMRERNEADGVRFSMLQVIREFALVKLDELGEAGDIRLRHLAWVTAFAQRSAAELVGQSQRTGLRSIDVERDNIQAALQYALTIRDRPSGLSIVSALWLYWNTRGMISEGLEWTTTFLEMDEEIPEALLAAGYFTKGILCSHGGDMQLSMVAAKKALELSEAVGNPIQLGLTHYLLGLNANKSFDHSVAVSHFDNALTYFFEAGEITGESAILNDLGRAYYLQGDLEQAKEHYNKALHSARTHKMPRSISMSLHNLGILAIDTGDQYTAAKYNLEALSINLEHGDEWHIMLPLIALVRVASESEHMTLAARLTGVAEALVNQPGVTLWDWTLPDDYAQTLATTRTILADEQLQSEIAKGRQLSLETAISEAQVLLQQDDSIDLTKLLTRRELDVLQLLLAGQSDREIGESLFISHRTAQSHLSSVYRKFDVHSRSEAIEWARRRGLSPKAT